jgi:hypothetical protein
MNWAAWLPSRTAPEGGNAVNSRDNGAAPGNDVGMATIARLAKPLRVLVAEGSSTSAREAITILGLSGHLIEVTAIPIASAWRDSRDLCENFIIVRGCGTIRPDFSDLSKPC